MKQIFYLSIKKTKNCLFSRRMGFKGKRILGYSICMRLFGTTIFSIPLLCILAFGCGEKKEPGPNTIIGHAYQPIMVDSIRIIKTSVPAPEPPKKLRHFLIGYYTALSNGGSSYGSITLGNLTEFPTAKEMKDEIYCQLPRGIRSKKKIMILGIYEFKNDEEFLSFGQGIYEPSKPCK